jgi:hypothetical protein
VPDIRLNDVPPDVYATLRRRATKVGMSLEEYVWERLFEDASNPTLDQIRDRVEVRTGGKVPLDVAVSAVRIDRMSQ